MSSDGTLNTLAERINDSWHKSAEGVLETGKLCAEAQEQRTEEELKDLKSKLAFSESTFTKLAKIGANKQLEESKVMKLLPPHFSIVYDIASMEKKDLDRALKEDVINPGMTRQELQEWKALLGGKKKKPEVEEAEVLATLKPAKGFRPDQQAELIKKFRQLAADFHFSIEGLKDPEQQEANASEAIVEKVRKDTRRYIRELKSQRLRTDGIRKLTKAQRRERWPYTKEQWDIASDADWDRCEKVLKLLGVGDEFARIKEGVLRLHGYTEEMLKKHENDDQGETLNELKVILTEEQAPSIKGIDEDRPTAR